MKKIKVKTFISFSAKKYSSLQKKNGVWSLDSKIISYGVSLSELKKRVHFILSLVCDFSTELSIRFCDSTEMQNQNSYFKKKVYPTDVLSFPPQSQNPDAKIFYLGDILICFPVCFYQANSAHQTLAQELEKMLIHGIVHLKGFDHERGESAWKVMTQLEKVLKNELEKELGKPKWCKVT